MTDFGRDTSTVPTLRTGRLSSGVRLVAENAFNRLRTPRGTLRGGEDEANYGLDLSDLIGASDPASLAASMPGQIRSELKKDERINDVTATVVSTAAGPSTSFDITISADTDKGPFTLRLAASGVTVELLGLTVGVGGA